MATVPLMVVAAFLGALIAEALSVHHIPTTVSLAGIVAVALAGNFLPVPMAFDVAMAFFLMTRGVPPPYVVTLLCTLGAFSVYPMLSLPNADSGTHHLLAHRDSPLWLRDAARDRSRGGHRVNPARPLT